MANLISFLCSVFQMLFGTGIQMPALPTTATTLSSTPTTAIVRTTEPQGYTIPPVEKTVVSVDKTAETQKIVSMPVRYEAYKWGNPQKTYINGEKEITVNMEGERKKKIVFVANGSVVGVSYATENSTVSVPNGAKSVIIYSAVGSTARIAPSYEFNEVKDKISDNISISERKAISVINPDGQFESISSFIIKMNDEKKTTIQMESLTAKGYIDVPSPISEEAVSPFGEKVKASPIDLIIRYEVVGDGAVAVNPVTGVVTAKNKGNGTVNCFVTQRVNGENVTIGTVKATFMVS